MKAMVLLILLLAVPTAWARDGEAGWSKEDNGLRGRLIVLPPKDAAAHFYRVELELENVANVMGQRKIPFDLSKIRFRVTGKDGQEVRATTAGSYDGMKPPWQPTLLPYGGAIRFLISFPGMGYMPGEPPAIDLGPDLCWVIPREGGPYFLAGTLKIEASPAGHPIMDWHGTLELPPAEIPVGKAN